jgi:cell division protein FtsW (lipid II flippase)
MVGGVPLPARVLCLWSVTLITTIFLVVRVDSESDWNYFVVFVPVLIYDGVLILVVSSRIIRHSRRRFYDDERTVKRKLWFLLLVVLNFIFVCLVSSKLDGHVSFSWYYVFTVLWMLLILVAADTTRFLRQDLNS